jgi:hypothetical protein
MTFCRPVVKLGALTAELEHRFSLVPRAEVSEFEAGNGSSVGDARQFTSLHKVING